MVSRPRWGALCCRLYVIAKCRKLKALDFRKVKQKVGQAMERGHALQRVQLQALLACSSAETAQEEHRAGLRSPHSDNDVDTQHRVLP